MQGEIIFPKDKDVYLSINGTGLTQCKYSSTAINSLSTFLTNNLLTVKGATPDKTEAEKNNIRYASCESMPENPVIIIQAGNETKVEKKQDNCYIISISNCEALEAVERFEVQAILDAKNSDPFN